MSQGGITSSQGWGRRLLPSLIDDIAKESPGRVYSSYPRTSNLKDGFLDVTYSDFARSINRTAGWIEGTFGKSTTSDTLTYIGVPDMRYYILCNAAVKVGYKVSWLSKLIAMN